MLRYRTHRDGCVILHLSSDSRDGHSRNGCHCHCSPLPKSSPPEICAIRINHPQCGATERYGIFVSPYRDQAIPVPTIFRYCFLHCIRAAKSCVRCPVRVCNLHGTFHTRTWRRGGWYISRYRHIG